MCVLSVMYVRCVVCVVCEWCVVYECVMWSYVVCVLCLASLGVCSLCDLDV